jgi:hypothetical protein
VIIAPIAATANPIMRRRRGREGEYMVAFSLKEMNNKQKTSFVKLIRAITTVMKDRGFAVAEENYTNTTSSLPSNISIEKISFK